MNRIMLSVSLILLVLVMACGAKEEPAPQPEPQAQVQQPAPEPEPEPEPTPEPEPEPEPEPVKVEKAFKSVPGDYTIQVASWDTEENAGKLAEFYNGKGYDARVESADLENGLWFRVRIGHYKSSGDAHKVAEEIAEKYKSDIWLVRL
jgi:cell division protein FtsN